MVMGITVTLLFSAAFSAAIAALGWRARALTGAGALAASGVGTAILWRTGWPGLAALGAFFAGSSLISRLAPDPAADRFDAKGSRRDPAQVLANGGAATLAALLLPMEPALWAVTATLAAAAADTWATSVGGWSRTPPRMILNGRAVAAGTSGAISLLGTTGALIGAAVVAGSAAVVAGSLPLLVQGWTIGAIGMFTDSLLGATLQGTFHCPACNTVTERPRHRCGTVTIRVGGLQWVTNDVVNGASTLLAGLLGWLAWELLRP